MEEKVISKDEWKKPEVSELDIKKTESYDMANIMEDPNLTGIQDGWGNSSS